MQSDFRAFHAFCSQIFELFMPFAVNFRINQVDTTMYQSHTVNYMYQVTYIQHAHYQLLYEMLISSVGTIAARNGLCCCKKRWVQHYYDCHCFIAIFILIYVLLLLLLSYNIGIVNVHATFSSPDCAKANCYLPLVHRS